LVWLLWWGWDTTRAATNEELSFLETANELLANQYASSTVQLGAVAEFSAALTASRTLLRVLATVTRAFVQQMAPRRWRVLC
jgi:hypothetical protein